jgi:broad specificity phosphatase PhoE
MPRTIELRRHTDDDDDELSEDGVRAALELGAGVEGGYDLLVSSGAQRATQTIACLLAARGERVENGLVVERGLRSEVEDRWRDAYGKAGSGELEALEGADPELVAQDGAALAEGLKRIFSRLPEGGRALAVGHSPTNEAAVYGLTGERIAPMGKGEGVLVVAEGEQYRVDPLG